MGRKGGGRAGFVKASRAAIEDSDDEAPAAAPVQPVPAAEPAPKADGDKAQPEPPKISAKAAAFLKDASADGGADSDNDDEAPRVKGQESKGQMAQRHKREAKALKETAKRLGKKGKDEVAKLEKEMEARHVEEAAALAGGAGASVADSIALADSLYSATISGEPRGEGDAGKKLTKAQKRREQRARDDAERDARIAAEQAELGETERVAEERELDLLLAPLGLQVRDIPPDGHCLYRSFEDQLRALPEGEAAAVAAAAGADAAVVLSFQDLRSAAAAHMRAHADDFRDFVLEGDVAQGGDGASGDDVFEAYCVEVESTAAWGGHVEIQALSRALKAHVQVFSVGMGVLEVGEEHKGQGPTLRVCYLRHAYGLGEHYNSVGRRTEDAGGSDAEDGEEGS